MHFVEAFFVRLILKEKDWKLPAKEWPTEIYRVKDQEHCGEKEDIFNRSLAVGFVRAEYPSSSFAVNNRYG